MTQEGDKGLKIRDGYTLTLSIVGVLILAAAAAAAAAAVAEFILPKFAMGFGSRLGPRTNIILTLWGEERG